MATPGELQPFDILYLDDDIVAIDKPAGFHVHQPENPRRRVARELTVLWALRQQIDKWLYPVHRIDVGTEGVLLFALNKPSAAHLCQQFQQNRIRKTYFAIVRGYTNDIGEINLPLELDSTGELVSACTHYVTHSRVELPWAVGKRHNTARYSLVEVKPETGRYHQIRRHMARISHPLIGDREHGDSHHNRFFRLDLSAPGLWLKAKRLSFQHPSQGREINLTSHWSKRWMEVCDKLHLVIPAEGRTHF